MRMMAGASVAAAMTLAVCAMAASDVTSTVEWTDPALTTTPPVSATTILVDGIWCPAARMEFYKRRLGPAVGTIDIFRYDASGRESLTNLGSQLARHIRACSNDVNLVGFSMGSIVIRAAMDQDHTLPVKRVAFMCAPHHGSILAYLLPWLPACREMRPTSAFMKKLDALPWDVPTFNIWCPGDLMVMPGWSSRFGKATIQKASWVPAHIWPLFSPDITSEVAEFLKARDDERPSASVDCASVSR